MEPGLHGWLLLDTLSGGPGRGYIAVQRSGGFRQLYFLWLGVSPRQGNNLETQQLSGQGPPSGKDEGSLNRWSVGWKEFLEVKDELHFTTGGAMR